MTSVAAFAPDLADLGDPAEPAFLQQMRHKARAVYETIGLPTKRMEAWRFSSLKSISATPWGVATTTMPETLPDEWLIEGAHRLVFVNGRFAPQLSSTEDIGMGLTVGTLELGLQTRAGIVENHLGHHARFDDHAFRALNTALFDNGAFVHLPAGAEAEAPIQLLYVSTATTAASVSYPRTLIVADAGSRATVIESHVGSGRCLSCPVTEISLGEGAALEHVTLIDQDAETDHIASLQITLASNSAFTGHSIELGGAMIRSEVTATVAGEGASARLNGLYLSTDRQHVDNQVLVEHTAPRTTSQQLYRGILDGRSRAVFNGRILVAKHAQQIDAGQSNHNLLISDTAVVNSNPQLEIYADDVKCSHGSTVGRLDDDALFYLRSRGIPRAEAEGLLRYAFASDLIGRISIEPLRRRLEDLILERLPSPERLP